MAAALAGRAQASPLLLAKPTGAVDHIAFRGNDIDDFIARSVAPKLPDGASWTVLVEMKDTKKGIEGKQYDRHDPQVQYKQVTAPNATQIDHARRQRPGMAWSLAAAGAAEDVPLVGDELSGCSMRTQSTSNVVPRG